MGVDGYWIDAFSSYPGDDTERVDFVQMIRNVDPEIMVTTNLKKDYFTDENGVLLKVDSDDVGDTNDIDCKIIKMSAMDPWSDFTASHITP